MGDNVERVGTNTRYPGWNRVTNPGVGWLGTQTTFTADRFSTATGGMEVDFSADLPTSVKARAVIATVRNLTAAGQIFARAKGDPNISNTPVASTEWATMIAELAATESKQVVIPLDDNNRAELAVSVATQDLNVSHAMWFLV